MKKKIISVILTVVICLGTFASLFTVQAATDTKAKKYSDYNKVSDFAKKSIAWAIDKGVINGMDSAHIGPQGNASRAQVAQILKNISDKNILPF